MLAAARCRLTVATDVAKSMVTPHGVKYVLDGRIETPTGKTPIVRTIWIVECGWDKPRLVTAYPYDE